MGKTKTKTYKTPQEIPMEEKTKEFLVNRIYEAEYFCDIKARNKEELQQQIENGEMVGNDESDCEDGNYLDLVRVASIDEIIQVPNPHYKQELQELEDEKQHKMVHITHKPLKKIKVLESMWKKIQEDPKIKAEFESKPYKFVYKIDKSDYLH